jgi:hypothetical protein
LNIRLKFNQKFSASFFKSFAKKYCCYAPRTTAANSAYARTAGMTCHATLRHNARNARNARNAACSLMV